MDLICRIIYKNAYGVEKNLIIKCYLFEIKLFINNNI